MIVDAIHLDILGQATHHQLDVCHTNKHAHGITSPEVVVVNGNHIGFLKNSARYDDTDTLELVLNYVGRLLGVRFSNEFYIQNRHGKDFAGLLSNRDSLPGYSYYEMDSALSLLWHRNQSEALREIAETWQQICVSHRQDIDDPDSGYSICANLSECLFTIELPVKALECSIGRTQGFIDSYVKMVLFDICVGNVDRTFENYGILLNDAFDDVVLGGLYDCATLRKPHYPNDCYTINGITFKRNLVMNALLTLFPQIVKDYKRTMAITLDKNLEAIKNACLRLCINKELISLLVERIDCFISNGYED